MKLNSNIQEVHNETQMYMYYVYSKLENGLMYLY